MSKACLLPLPSNKKSHAGNPRSTVGTMTEIYDYLRILYARLGIPHDPDTGEVIKAISKDLVVEKVMAYPEGDKIQVLAPIELHKTLSFEEMVNKLRQQGFLRLRLNGSYYDLDRDTESLIPAFDRKRKNELHLVIDRLKVNPSIQHRLYEAVETAADIGNRKLVIVHEDQDIFFNLSFAVESTGKSYPEITPHTFAFNTAEGMCWDCMGLGYQYGANLFYKPDIMNQSLTGLLQNFWLEKSSRAAKEHLEIFCDKEKINPHLPLKDLPSKALQLIFNGTPEEKWYAAEGYSFRWTGINSLLTKAAKSASTEIREAVIPLLDELECLSCKGSRLNPLARHVTLQGLSISGLCQLPVQDSLKFIEDLKLPSHETRVLDDVFRHLKNRLNFLSQVGLDYLSLNRRAPTLSGGEAQRIRLARQLGSGLTGVLYVLDEPTIGLHPRDNERLNEALKKLKALGNTLLLVEHDPLTLQTADYILDFGPQSGNHGGHITAKGTLKQILRNSKSLTGAYLSGKNFIGVPEKRRKLDKGSLAIIQANLHNLKDVSVKIPLGAITCLTGVSGSGKSTLMQQVLLPAVEKGLFAGQDKISNGHATISGISQLDKVLSIDQNPIGHTARSDVGTYVDVLSRMREFFASLPVARAKGFQGKHFSYNHRRGMCTSCWGMGYKKVEMYFLPSVRVVCDECKGMRLNPSSLEVKYQGKNFGEYLNMTVDESRRLFENHPRIIRILDTLISVGLGYLKLGQEMVSLSGGEAQRVKLSRELAKRSTGKTLYLMDEPTTGLHWEDIKKLLLVLHKLADKGNTIVIIEHNLDIIKNADHVIELGPEAGDKGGEIICQGPPETIAECQNSWTGKYLKPNIVIEQNYSEK